TSRVGTDLKAPARRLSAPAARLPDLLEPLLQRRLLAVVGQLEEALALGLLWHQLLRGDALGAVVRVVVALTAPQSLGGGVGGALERSRRDHGAVLAHPLARLLQSGVRGVRLRREREVDRRLRQVERGLREPHVLDGVRRRYGNLQRARV